MTYLIMIIAFQYPVIVAAQFVARMEVKEPISGACDQKNIYALLPGFQGQESAVCPISKEEILQRLNTEITFLQSNPGFKGKGMIGLVIDCKGKVVQRKMDNSTKNSILDQEIESVFSDLGEWKPGKLDGDAVDAVWLFSFSVKKGKFAKQ